MDVLKIKILGLFIMFAGNLLLGLLPLKLVSYLQSEGANHPRLRTALGFINCFTGGVFFGTFLIHLFPEVRQEFEKVLLSWKLGTAFPMAEFTISIGFFMVLIIESIVTSCHANYRQREMKPVAVSTSNSFDVGYGSLDVTSRHLDNEAENVRVRIVPVDDVQEQQSVAHVLRETTVIRAFIFLISLSLHSLFAGLAIGLQKTPDDVLTLFIAIDSHKWIIAFALGMELAEASLGRCKCVLYMCLFAVMSPIGVVIGIFVDTVDVMVQSMVSCVLQAMAAGTILYVTFFEVLNKELADRHNLLRIIFVILGFATMTGLKFLD